ncbi:UPF0488 protein CG14286 [Phymastichus coffea]|uniref:UPF0488 protein CG14286 n=1 Tax=Phymastichus coffea TaxID=108790 RepID=UPI00273AAF4A|nr:UPF0488 protein CG14286 [Phymastichus coffea]
MTTKTKLPRNKVPRPKLAKPPSQVPQNRQSSFTSLSSAEPQTASGLNQEAEDQFELELCWCVQQLEAALMNVNLQEKQVYNMTKSLNVLKSHNASLIKKRQVMRNTFGDYRTKMTEDEKKFGKTTGVVKFTTDNNKAQQKAIFLKKASSLLNRPAENKDEPLNQTKTIAIMNSTVSNEPFKFNFCVDEL